MKKKIGNEREGKLNEIFDRIEVMEDEIKGSKIVSNVASKSLQRLNQQLSSLSKRKLEKFTSSKYYLDGKLRLNQFEKSDNRRKSVENMLRFITSQSPQGQNFLTPEITQKDSFKQAIKSRKRNFGFVIPLSPSQILTQSESPFTRKQSLKILKTIIKAKKQANPVVPRKKFLKKGMQHGINSISPSYRLLPLSPEPYIHIEDSEENFDITRQYQETILKQENEAKMRRIRLSKLLGVRRAVETAKKLI